MKKLMILAVLLAGPAQAAPFDFALFRELAKKPGNVFFSPYSVRSALAMTSAGARGETQAQMLRTLGLEKDPHEKMAELRKALTLEGENQPVLTIANQLWGKTGQDYHAEFLKLTQTQYGAGLTPLDYAADPEAARKKINDWVEKQTREKIKDLLPEGSIQRNTDLVLTNAIYFKGKWLKDFSPQATSEGKFFPLKGKARATPFLRQTGKFLYAENETLQALRMLYQGGDTAFTLYLPHKGKSLARLNLDSLSPIGQKMLQQEVRVSLPKFRAEYSAALEKILPKLGMKLPFTSAADFSGIRALKPGENLSISGVMHKAFIEVDEKGTEAAAATGVAMVGTALPLPPKEFTADRPFLYAIEHLPSQTILFLGRFAEP